MVEVEQHEDGVILPVRAMPGAKKSEIRGQQDGSLKVAVTQVAEKGKANKALIAQLSKSLGLRKSQISLVAGVTSPNKRFLIHGIQSKQLQARIAEILEAK